MTSPALVERCCERAQEQRLNQAHVMITKTKPTTQRSSPKPARRAPRVNGGGWRAEHGFTIVEVMVAALILIVGGLSLVGLVDAANGATTSNKQREAGTNLAREVIENVGTISYDDVTPTGVVTALQARDGLADSSANTGYTIERRDVTFAVDVEACNLDDAGDGVGSHATGSDGVDFCSGSGADGTSDAKPADYRRATATLTWTFDGETKTVRQSSFVMPPSGSDLPVVTTLSPSPGSPITSAATEEVNFSATTSSIPAGVSWSQDGSDKGEAAGGGTSWNFTWPIGTVATGLADGDYVIGARARTGGGSYGPVHGLTMKLNRSVPAAPQGFVAGQNGSSVDAEWLANEERDVEGYTVYRQKTAPTAGLAQQVNCGTVGTPVYITTSLNCTDASPLAPTIGPITFVSASPLEANWSETSTLSVTTPSGVVAGDVMIANIASSTTGAAVTAPAGWTLIRSAASTNGGNGIRHASYYRVVTSAAEPASYVWNVGAVRSNSGSITAWRGVDTTTPIDASAQQLLGSNGATETAPTVTTTQANGVVLRAYAHRGPSNNPPAMTLTTPTSNTLRAGARSYTSAHGQYSRAQAAAGASGTATSTCASSCTQWVAFTIALKAKNTLAANYWVKAVDLDAAGNYREGAASSSVAAYAFNTAPTAPTGLTGTAAASGSNDVSWTTQGTDADAGDSVAFYRVYRDGVRFDRTATGTDTTWTDARPGSGTHTYLLRAVDTRLAESPSSTSVTVTQP